MNDMPFFPPRPRRFSPTLESLMMQTLRSLPSEYECVQPAWIKLPSEPKSLIDFYCPDFEVRDTEGRTVLVEILTPATMGIISLAISRDVDALVRAKGKGYLLLQWGEDISAGLRAWPVFSKLHIRLVKSPAEAVREIEDEFTTCVVLAEGTQQRG